MKTEELPSYSVKELNEAIGNLLHRGFAPRFLLNATVSKSQLKKGHLWLTLNDEKASISAVVWSSVLKSISFKPDVSDGVIVLGKINFWESRATLSVQVLDIRPSISTVLRKFEVVREKLTKEGLILLEKKRILPKYPNNIGILTSVPSSALADMLRTAKERWPLTKLIIIPIPVQGDVANNLTDVLKKISLSYKNLALSAIILARGGGNREDLILFDDENLCREIANYPIPVITGIGHEDDLVVADLVADHRAATPTAAIIALLPSRDSAIVQCIHIRNRLYDLSKWFIGNRKAKVLEKFETLSNYLPMIKIQKYKEIIDKKRILLDALSPQKLLSRGFAILQDQYGQNIHSIKTISSGDQFIVKLTDGKIEAKVVKLIQTPED